MAKRFLMEEKGMKHPPIIGILSGEHGYGQIVPVYSTGCHYLEQLQEAGGVPLQIPVLPGLTPEAVENIINVCDGFLLPGGGDFSPEWYGQTLLPGLPRDSAAISWESQKVTLALIRAMAKSGKPILGICLGIQVLTIAFGGALYQDIPTLLPSEISHAKPITRLEDRWRILHTVRTAEGSLIRRLTGAAEIPVNSNHHQAIKTLGQGFTATAWSADGIVEAMESDCGRILGVQWHPENLAHAGAEHAKALFRWLVHEAQSV